MSSIIDALKKSDDNRNADDSSSVNQIKFSDNEPPTSRKGFWLLVIILLLVAGGVFAWQQGWHNTIVANTKSLMGSDPQTSINTSSEPQISKPQQSTTPEKSTLENQNKLVPPKTTTVIDRAAKQRNQEHTAQQTKKTEMANIESPDIKATGIKVDESIDEIVPVEMKKDSTIVANKTSKSKNSKEPQLKQDYLLVHQIPFEIRKNIPPIKLSIHIYDPEPENRMVLMNGVKLGVGDVIEELVEIKDITKEGVVLKFESVEFLVPK